METISEELETITITEREIQYTDEHLAAPSSSQHPERNGAVPDFDTSEAESSTANFASSRISLEAETDWTLVLDTVVEAITNEQSIVDQTLDEALNATILDAHNKTVLPNLLLDHAPQSQRETIMAALLELQEVSARIDTEELPDDLPLAVSTLSNAIERYENCGSKGTGAAVVCKLQSTLASLLGAQGRLQESASVYRLCLAGYEKEIGMSSIESIEVRSSLINNLTQLGNFDEAIALCTRALGYCRLESNKRGEMHCIFDRALIYQRMSRNIEAITELIFLLTKALKHEFTAVPILQLLQSIQELVLLFRSSLGKGTNVVSVLRRMIGIAEENPDHPDWDCEPFPPLFFKAMELAAWCSYLRDRSGSSPLRQPAERLFRVGITRLEQSSNTRGYTRAAVYYWYANHLNRQRYQINGASYLLSSWEVLVQCECTKEDLGFRILKKIKDIVPFLTSVKQTGKTAEADKIELLLARASKALPKDNSIKYTLQNPLEIESVDEDIREVSSMEYDAMTILSHSTNTTGKSTGSSGFGVTFSESEYLGYNVADLVGTQK
jgi:tetratricopeptide (TPR) repeat protein